MAISLKTMTKLVLTQLHSWKVVTVLSMKTKALLLTSFKQFALAPKSPLDFDKRVNAVNHFRTLPEAAALAAANKRVANILAKEAAPEGSVVEANLVEDAEKHYLLSFKQ